MPASARALVALALVAGAVAVWYALSASSPEARSGGSPHAFTDDDSALPPEIARAGNRDLRIPPTPAEIARGGVLRGAVRLDPGLPDLPPNVTVRVRPSRFMVGRETAASRDLEMKRDRSFAVEGLPFGAYEVRAVAPGWNGIPSEVQLAPLEPNAYVTIRCVPAAKLIGQVRDTTRAAVDQIRIELKGTDELGEKVSRTARSTSDGGFLFENVLDGDYAISVGSEGAPMIPPLLVTVARGAVPFSQLEVPALGALDVTVLSTDPETPLDGFFVTATSAVDPARIDSAVSGTDGVAAFRNLLPGKYSILATRDYFKRASGAVDVEPGKLVTAKIRSKPLVDGLVPDQR